MCFVTLNKQLDGREVLYNKENNFQSDCAVVPKKKKIYTYNLK